MATPYQVIARKYRPQRFADVVGQDHVTQTLINAIRQNRLAHAYLFVGPRGTGKTTMARILAKCLNCTGGPKVEIDDADPRCQEIAEGRSLDVLEIDGASNRGIEEIRELRETVKYAPAVSRFKIYIIDEVHMLTKEAFNALLKTLEEPPEHVKFMFATTEAEKVLPTILSRCQRFDLRRIPTSLLVQQLAKIGRLEGVEADELALHAIARGADGGMRDAESALDQLISFCGNRITEADVLSMFGLTARGQLMELAQAIIDQKAERALRLLQEIAKGGKDLHRLLSDLLNHLRNLLLFKICGGDTSLLDASDFELKAIQEQAARLSTETLTRLVEILSEHEGKLREVASKRILIEVALLKAIQARSALSIDAVIQRLQELRGEAESGSSSPPAASAASPAEPRASVKPASPVSPPPKASAPPAPPARVASASAPSSGDELVALWNQVVEAVGRASPFAKTYLLEAHPVSFANKIFTIGFDPEFADHVGLVDNAKNHTLLRTKLEEFGHAQVQIKFVVAEAPNRPAPVAAGEAPPSDLAAPKENHPPEPSPALEKKPAPAGAPLSKEDFKNDPLIKQALEIFKGTIVEVRS